MIQAYLKSNLNYHLNGDYVLTPTKGTLKVELNGICEIDLEHPYDKEGRWKLLTEDNIISAKTPWSEQQLFRICEISKDIDGLKVFARHIFFDLINTVILDKRPTVKTGEEALRDILEGTNFISHSDITKVGTAYYIRKNRLDALFGRENNSFINIWGGELFIDNYNVHINNRIGNDYGVTVKYGKNLKEIEETVNYEDVVTRIIPVGFNGITLDPLTPYIDSPLIGKYPFAKEQVIKFDDVKLREKETDEGFATLEEAREELIRRSLEQFTQGIDTPSLNMKVEMELLENTLEYKDFKILESVNLGDDIKCIDSVTDIDIKARVIAYEYDLINNKYLNVELGSFEKDYFKEQSDVTSNMKTTLSRVVNDDGSLKAEQIKGFIDGTKSKYKVSAEVAEKQEPRVILFEDLDINSPTYGALILGTQGIFVSRTRTLDNKDWEPESALTSEGLIADKIVGDLFSSKEGNTTIDMNTGEYKSTLADGSQVIISPANGFYRKIGSSKNEYHSLIYTSFTQLPPYTGEGAGGSFATIQLPEEFKNKVFRVMLSIRKADAGYLAAGGRNSLNGFGIHVDSIDYTNARVTLWGYSNEIEVTNKNNIQISYLVIA